MVRGRVRGPGAEKIETLQGRPELRRLKMASRDQSIEPSRFHRGREITTRRIHTDTSFAPYGNTMRRYYLSKFEGDGSNKSPYQAYVARFGRCNILDYRRDETVRGGWCLACVEGDELPDNGKFQLLADLDFLVLCDDPNEPLPNVLRERIRNAIELEFTSLTLKDIIVETQLLYSDIRPQTNGDYCINLMGELWSASEEETFAIKANHLFPFWDRVREPYEGSPRTPNRRDVESLLERLESIADVKERGWLSKALDDPKMVSHPFVSAYREVHDLLQEKNANFSQSYSLIWLMRLDHDWGSLLDVMPIDIRSSSRLQEVVDCESLKYELFVMAPFKRRGATVVWIDEGREKSAECKVSWGNAQAVYLECKRKSTKSIRRRDSEATFKELKGQVFHLMDELKRPATVIVSSQYDPTDDVIPRVLAHLECLLQADENPIGSVRVSSRLLIEVAPAPFEEAASGKRILRVPRGFDFASSEVQIGTPLGKSGAGRCFAWRTEQRVRWIRSAITAVEEAARQLPADQPGVVYLQVPEGPPAVVWLRMRILADEVRQILQHEHQRIAAVVVTGEWQWMKTYIESDESTAVVSTYYEVVENSNTRNPLPDDFQLFGRDFYAKQIKGVRSH